MKGNLTVTNFTTSSKSALAKSLRNKISNCRMMGNGNVQMHYKTDHKGDKKLQNSYPTLVILKIKDLCSKGLYNAWRQRDCRTFWQNRITAGRSCQAKNTKL